MQAALTLLPPYFTSVPPPSRTGYPPNLSLATSKSLGLAKIRTNAQENDYSSANSVFPAEACEIIGGDSCLADTFPEVKLKQEASKPTIALEPVDREYLDYAADPRTVLLGDACDVLGGEFCEPGDLLEAD